MLTRGAAVLFTLGFASSVWAQDVDPVRSSVLVIDQDRLMAESGFGERLARVCDLPIRFVEETLTTREADERLRQAGVRLRGKRGRRDAVAAQLLLQEALDQPVAPEPTTTNDEIE